MAHESEFEREVKRLAFEERRVQRVKDHLWELERDHLEIFRAVEQNIIHVPYYETKETQDQFLNSIAHTAFGSQMLRMQDQWNRDLRIPLILPKFSNFPNITTNEQQWLAMFGLSVSEDEDGKRFLHVSSKPDAFKRITGPYIFGQQVDPSTSAGYRTNTLKYGYEEPEPQVKKDCPMYCDIVYVPTNTVAYSGLCSCSMLENYQNDPDYRIDQISKRETKPDYRDTQPEPEKPYTVYGQILPLSQSAVDYYESLGVPVTTAEIDPYVPPTELPFVTKKPPSVFQPVEPEVTTDHIEPPEFHDISSAEEESRKYELWEQQQFAKESEQERLDRLTTSQVEPPGVEEPEVITSQVEPPGQEVTAEISWFGDTWFPWHLELDDRRRR